MSSTHHCAKAELICADALSSLEGQCVPEYNVPFLGHPKGCPVQVSVRAFFLSYKAREPDQQMGNPVANLSPWCVLSTHSPPKGGRWNLVIWISSLG